MELAAVFGETMKNMNASVFLNALLEFLFHSLKRTVSHFRDILKENMNVAFPSLSLLQLSIKIQICMLLFFNALLECLFYSGFLDKESVGIFNLFSLHKVQSFFSPYNMIFYVLVYIQEDRKKEKS